MTRIQELPKVELHVHIEGTLEPELVLELARDAGVELPYPDAESLRSRYVFGNLQSFLDIYYENMAVLRRRPDFGRLAYEYARRAHAGGVVHAEVFFDPQAHRIRGVPVTDRPTTGGPRRRGGRSRVHPDGDGFARRRAGRSRDPQRRRSGPLTVTPTTISPPSPRPSTSTTPHSPGSRTGSPLVTSER